MNEKMMTLTFFESYTQYVYVKNYDSCFFLYILINLFTERYISSAKR